MQNKKTSLRLALITSLLGFVGLVWIASGHNRYNGGGGRSEITYGLDVKMKWVAEDPDVDFAFVQDTLSFYANVFGTEGTALKSSYRLDHCCEDPALRLAVNGAADFYQLQFSADFARPILREQLLKYLVDLKLVYPSHFKYRFGMANANADFRLPVPGSGGRVLYIDGSEVELSFVPRVTSNTGGEPLA